jgi:hypothetical protein
MISYRSYCMRDLVKTIGIVVMIGLGIPFIILVFLWNPPLPTVTHIANGIKSEDIRKIWPGMSMEQVLKILGRPYGFNALMGMHTIGCATGDTQEYDIEVTDDLTIRKRIAELLNDSIWCCDGNREDKMHKQFCFTYTRNVSLFPHPMLRVHFDGNYEVSFVYAKKYAGWDSYCIYNCSWKWDDLRQTDIKGDTSLFIDQADFADCFN